MSLAGKLADIADVAFPQMTKKQAEGVVSAISKISDDEAIREAVKALDQAQMDSLMKAIYKGLETMEGKSSSVLFKWHAVVCTPPPLPSSLPWHTLCLLSQPTGYRHRRCGLHHADSHRQGAGGLR